MPMIAMLAATAALVTCSAPRTVDGDTIACAAPAGERGIRVRLLAVDAADHPDSAPCRQARPNYVCDAREHGRATTALRELMRGAVITYQPITTDRYGRPVSLVFAGGRNLSCAMLAAGRARYVARYDNGRRIARACPTAIGAAS